MKQVLSALRSIAGNDDVKDAIVRAGGTESIVAAMTQHLANPQVSASGVRGGVGGWRAAQFLCPPGALLFLTSQQGHGQWRGARGLNSGSQILA